MSGRVDGDSPLAFIANVLGILTFIIAAVAALYSRLLIYSNTQLQADIEPILEEIALFLKYADRSSDTLGSSNLDSNIKDNLADIISDLVKFMEPDECFNTPEWMSITLKIYILLQDAARRSGQESQWRNGHDRALVFSRKSHWRLESQSIGIGIGNVQISFTYSPSHILQSCWKMLRNFIDPKWRQKKKCILKIQNKYRSAWKRYHMLMQLNQNQ
jgi:hypothetical protein